MGRGSNKTFTNKMFGMMRRLWSFPKIRICIASTVIILILIFVYFLYANNNEISVHTDTQNQATSSKLQSKSNSRIACLIVGDSRIIDHPKFHDNYLYAIESLLAKLQIYDQYVSPFCDIKVFIVNNSNTKFPYNSEEIAVRLPHSEFLFIPRNNLKYDRKQRLHTYHTVSYAYKHYKDYEWYLKFNNVDKLIMVDHFKKVVYDENGANVYNMDEPQLIGHAIKDECADFIYSKTVYALNQAFLLQIGKVATQNLQNDNVHIKLKKECKSHGLCNRHTQDDFVGFCLTDLGVNIQPIRDEQNREYFLIYNIRDHYVKMNEWKEDWYWYGKSKESVAENCCAEYPVVFSNYAADRLAIAYSKIYSVTPPERNMKFLSSVNFFDSK